MLDNEKLYTLTQHKTELALLRIWFCCIVPGGTTSHWVHAKAPERIPYPLVNSLTWLEKNHHITCIDDVFFVSLLGSFVTIFHPINGEIFAPTGRRCSGATLQRQGASHLFFFSLLKVKVCLPGLNPKRKCWGDGWPFFPKLGGYLAMLQHGGGNRHTKFLETKKVNKNSKIFFSEFHMKFAPNMCSIYQPKNACIIYIFSPN